MILQNKIIIKYVEFIQRKFLKYDAKIDRN